MTRIQTTTHKYKGKGELQKVICSKAPHLQSCYGAALFQAKLDNLNVAEIDTIKGANAIRDSDISKVRINQCTTHPSHKPKDKPNPNLDSTLYLREGWVGHFQENQDRSTLIQYNKEGRAIDVVHCSLLWTVDIKNKESNIESKISCWRKRSKFYKHQRWSSGRAMKKQRKGKNGMVDSSVQITRLPKYQMSCAVIQH